MPYIGKSPEFGVRERFYFTQTSAGATSISGFDDNGTTLRFTDGNYVDVYLNGVLLVDGVDYGTSTANTISSLSALADEDVIEIVVYDVFNLAKNQAEVTRTRYYKTASGSETSISGNDDNGVAITFPAGAQLDVSLNGVSLVAGTDYNTSTANTISGLSALSAGQVIEIVKYEKFVVSDTVSAAAGGTFSGAVSINSSNFKMPDLTANAFYRTGTFTPIWTSASVTTAYESNLFTNASYTIQKGDYVRIGDMVHATIFIKLDYSATAYANGGAAGQSLAMVGLPFKVKNVANYYPMSSTFYFNVDTAGSWSSYNWVGFGRPDKKDIVIYYSSSGGTVSTVASTIVYYTGQSNHDSEVMVQLTYETDEA